MFKPKCKFTSLFSSANANADAKKKKKIDLRFDHLGSYHYIYNMEFLI